jgi:hypothetical protein
MKKMINIVDIVLRLKFIKKTENPALLRAGMNVQIFR